MRKRGNCLSNENAARSIGRGSLLEISTDSLPVRSRKKLSCSFIENRNDPSPPSLRRIPIDFERVKNSFRKMVHDRNFRFKGLFGFSILGPPSINYSYSFRLNTPISIHFNAFECGRKNRRIPLDTEYRFFFEIYIYIYIEQETIITKKVHVYIKMEN